MIDVIPNKTFLWSRKFPKFEGGKKYSINDDMAKQMVELGYAKFADKITDPVVNINGERVECSHDSAKINIKSDIKALNPGYENKALNTESENKTKTKHKSKKRG
jgi:hypothetical protein